MPAAGNESDQPPATEEDEPRGRSSQPPRRRDQHHQQQRRANASLSSSCSSSSRCSESSCYRTESPPRSPQRLGGMLGAGGRRGSITTVNNNTSSASSSASSLPSPPLTPSSALKPSQPIASSSSSSSLSALPTSLPSPPASEPGSPSPAPTRPVPPPAVPSPGYTIKRACQPGDKRAPGNAINRAYFVERDQLGLVEYRLRSYRDNPRLGACALCDPENWLFHGSQYDPFLSLLYAERDGCIPSSVVAPYTKFVVPWRYKNKRTGEITWKIFHLSGDKITSADSETIIVNSTKDVKLRNAIRRVTDELPKHKLDPTLVEFLLKVVRDTLGDYGLPGGPTSADADARLYQQMLRQGHNLMLLCEVDIGLCRHKALLFKILCDISGLNCALVTGYSTAGRHQWNIITLPDRGDFLIDPTSPHFTWATKGSHRTRGYRVSADQSFGHSGFTQKENGII